jgi:DNA-binding winged helix-turn-helix (wHTH) protein/predicted ATPase
MEQQHPITFGPFRLETPQSGLWRGDQRLPLRPRSLALLGYLVGHAGHVVTKAELHAHVWRDTHVTDSVLRTSVHEIRAALGDAAGVPQYLETVGRQGYRWLGGSVAAPLTALVAARTDGNALFMVTIVEHLVQQGFVGRWAGQWTLREAAEAQVLSLPAELHALLLWRIDALPLEARRVLEVATVVGEAFAVAAVAAGGQVSLADVEAVCVELAAQRHVLDDTGWTVWPDGTRGGTYRFRHALYRQALYERLGTMQRVQLHGRIGARLEAGYGAQAGEIATQLALHFEHGGEVQRAVHYLQQAGDNATRRNAHHEAITALTKGRTLLATLPESLERNRHELALLLILGELLMVAKGLGAPEAGEVYTQAQALCQQVGEPRQRFQVLRGLYRFYGTQAQFQTAGALSQQLLDLAHHHHDDINLVLEGHMAMGSVALPRSDLVTARAHFEHSLRLCNRQRPPLASSRGHADRVITRTLLGQTLWGLGYADQAQQHGQDALTQAQQTGHPLSLAYARAFAARLAQWRRDVAATQAHAEALMTFAVTHGFGHRVALGRCLRGWALAMQGDAAAGVAEIHQGCVALHEMGHKLYRPYDLALLAEAYGQGGQPETGVTVLAEAVTLVAATEERWWEAEVSRLQGALLLQLPLPAVGQAEACFQQALDVARRQQAKALELRAALSLARLWQRHGQPTAARQLLAPIYGWFTEGFDTVDFQEAKALLAELVG